MSAHFETRSSMDLVAEAWTRDLSQEDSVMSLPENQQAKPGAVPMRGNSKKGIETRGAFGSLDGSPSVGGLTPTQPSGQRGVGSGTSQFHMPSSHLPPAGQGRASEIRVFDEFRDRHVYDVDRRVRARDFAYLPSPSAGTSSASNSGGGPSEAPVSQQPLPVFNFPVAPSPAVAAIQADEEELADIQMEDKENGPRPADMHPPPANPGTWTGLASEREALMDLVLEVPLEFQEHPDSDIESDDEEEMESENLAEKLDERIRDNVDGRYDFQIYCDP